MVFGIPIDPNPFPAFWLAQRREEGYIYKFFGILPVIQHKQWLAFTLWPLTCLLYSILKASSGQHMPNTMLPDLYIHWSLYSPPFSSARLSHKLWNMSVPPVS